MLFMKRIRVIPLLLINNSKLVKSINFKNYQYVGDPINAVKIFNEKEVDELAFVDITASKEKRKPNLEQIRRIASEAFMPIAYGGGISNLDEVKSILLSGIEKVILNKAALENSSLIGQIANVFGSQSVIVSIDVKKNIWGKYKVFSNNGTTNTGLDPLEFALKVQSEGAGEIFLNSIERDGTYKGYDIDLINLLTSKLSIPLIACGGAGAISDFKLAVDTGKASAVAAGSMFVFKRPHNAVLISYPSQDELIKGLYK